MHRWLKSGLVIALLLGTAFYALAEDITLTTYYPSPRGVYQELRATSNLVIGSVNPADPSALLDIVSPTGPGSVPRGLLPPRITTEDRDTRITSPAQGLLVFNTTTRLFNYHDGTGWAPLASRASIPNIQVFDIPGAIDVPVPPGVTEIMVKVWGGGGGGGSYTGTVGGGGGGAGGYAEGVFSVTPGDTLAITVGNGGAGATGANNLPGDAGETSSVGTLISASGGVGGLGGGLQGNGGPGGSGTGGHLRITGGKGAPGLYNGGGAIGGGAGGMAGGGGGGAGGPGDSGGIAGQHGGGEGQFPGGGGGGGISPDAYSGARGAVIILF